MKRWLIAILMLFLLSGTSYAQGVVGVKGGSTTCWGPWLLNFGEVTCNADGTATISGGGTITGDTNIGSSTAGKNLTVNATLGTELITAPMVTGGWTLGYDTGGWAITAGVLSKTASTGTLTATAVTGMTSAPTIDVTYRVTIVSSAASGSTTYTLGGVTGTAISTATTTTDYITARTAAKIIFSGVAATTVSLTSVSIQALTDATGDVTVDGNLSMGSQVFLSDSGANAPTLAFRVDTNTGLFHNGLGEIGISILGTGRARIGGSFFALTGIPFGFGSTLDGGVDLIMGRDAADAFAQRRTTNQQIFRVYNTADAFGTFTNYERLTLTGVQGASVNVTAESAGTGSANLDVVITPKGTGQVKIIGSKGYLWIPAGSMTPITCAGLATVSQAPNMTDYLAFDGATDEYAGFTISLEDWDLSTIKAKFVWYASAAMTNAHTVIWGLNCYAVSDGDTSDVAFNSGEVTVEDAYATSDETGPIQKTSAATVAITVQGTPASGDVVYCRVSRDADTDTSTIDAWLVGVKLVYGKTVPTVW